MTSYIASWIPAIQSVVPKSSPPTSPLPEVGSLAPAPIGNIDFTRDHKFPTLVAFVRHCGCPFAEKEVHLLAAEAKKNSDLHVVIVQHSELAQTQQWFEDVG